MPSNVNPFNINGNYPIAGQDNDSQGFRDNFTNIRNNFAFIKAEVEDIQNKALLKSALIGTNLNNDLLNGQLLNVQVKNITETVFDWGTTAGEFDLDITDGNIQKIDSFGSIKIGQILNWPGTLQFSRLFVYLTVNSVSHTFELPTGITTDLTAIPGYRNGIVTFAEAGNYIFEFSSADSGATVFVRELTRGNPNFRDPNIYLSDISTNPTLRLGWGNLFATSTVLDSLKGGADTLSIKGPVTTYNNHDSAGNFANNKVAGYSVAKSRAVDPGAGNPVVETNVNDGDYVGYLNAYAYTTNRDQITNSYNEIGQIGFFSVGANTSIGGNIVISTRADGGTFGRQLLPAVVIDNKQDVLMFGNLTVLGNTITFNTETVVVEDKNIVLGNGATTGTQVDGGGITLSVANAQISYADTVNSWIVNKRTHISNGAASFNATTGALVVDGGAGIGGNLFVGGSFGLTGTDESTSPTTGGFILSGGIGVGKNIVTNGNIYANASTKANEGLTAGNGGAIVAPNGGAYIYGNVVTRGDNNTAGFISLSTLDATSSTSTASLMVDGGAAISKKVFVGGWITLSNTTAATSEGHGAFRANGGLAIQGNSWFFSPSSTTNVVKIAAGTAAFGNAAGGSSGALQVGVPGSGVGGISCVGNLVVGDGSLGNIYARATTPSINSTSGAVQVQGGVGVQGNIVVGAAGVGNIYAASGATTTVFNQGALVVTGGAGVSGNLVVQGNITFQGGILDKSANIATPTTGGNIILNALRHTTIVAPAGSLATLTVTMPDAGDGTELRVNFTQTVTTLTMTPKSGVVLQSPLTTASAGTFGTWLYVDATTTWYRVG